MRPCGAFAISLRGHPVPELTLVIEAGCGVRINNRIRGFFEDGTGDGER